jgi:hypothetical protein
MRWILLTTLVVWPCRAQDPVDIVRKSLDRDISNFEHLKNYTYQQREEDRDFDGQGKTKKVEIETTEVLILAGHPYERVIGRNDKPLSERDTRKEQEKMDKVLARQEKAKLEKRRAETRKFLNELPDAFHFRLVGEEDVSGKRAWVITADPRPDFHPKDMRAKLLSKLRGKLWIDQGEYQWVKVEANVLDTISLGMALFRVAPGGTIAFEQTRVNDEVWLPAHIHVRADARVAYVKKYRTEVDVTYRDYRKFQAESRILTAEEK